jgi:hypothetical protein
MSTKISKFAGTKNWEDSIFDENFKIMKENLSAAQVDRRTSLKMENARYGQQFSKAEVKQLLAFRQAPLPISISSAISDTADSLQVSAKPTIDVAPIINPYNDAQSENSYAVSSVFKHVLQKDWFDSFGALEYDKAIFDRTTTGTGLLYTVPHMEYGEFRAEVKNISWKFFIPDPASKDYLFRDSDNMVISMPLSTKAAYRFVQAIEPTLEFQTFKDNWINGAHVQAFPEEDKIFGHLTKDQVLFMQRLTLEVEDSYVIIPKNVEGQRGSDLSYRTASHITDNLLKSETAGEISITKERKMYLVEYTSVGKMGYKIVYPISKYNLIPMHYDHRGTPYTYGLMHRLYPLQRALNKFIMSSILNMALLNTTKIMAEEDSIIDENDWVQNASMPNAIMRYRQPVPGISKPPEIITPTPMDSAFLVMPQYITKMMEYVSGIFGTMMGNSEGQSDVFSTVASMQSAGGLKIKRRQAHADASLSLLGSVMADFYKEYAPMDGFSYKMDAEGKEDVIKYNELKAKRTKLKNGKSRIDLNVNPQNDLRTGYKNVRFTSTGSMGYEAATEAAMLTNLATQLKIPALVPVILERMNIPGLKDIRDNLDTNKNLTKENKNLQNIVKQIEAKNKGMEGQIFQVIKSLEAAKAKGKFDVELEKLKSDPAGYLKKATTMQGED